MWWRLFYSFQSFLHHHLHWHVGAFSKNGFHHLCRWGRREAEHGECRNRFVGHLVVHHNGAAAVYISNDGKYIYVSNRGHNSIAVFKVNDDHTLSLVQRVSTFGDFPRDFNWDESEKYLVAANQNSDNATLYLRNTGTGTLTPIQKDIEVPEGTRVLFTK